MFHSLIAQYSHTPWSQIIIEQLGALFSILSTLLGRSESNLVFSFSIISIIFYSYLLVINGTWAMLIIYLNVAVTSIYGWVLWVKHGHDKQLPIRHFNRSDLLPTLCFMLAIGIIAYGIHVHESQKWMIDTLDWLDVMGGMIAAPGMWLLGRKVIDNWTFWIISDIVCLPLFLGKQLYVTALLYLIMALIGVFSYTEWNRRMKLHQAVISCCSESH